MVFTPAQLSSARGADGRHAQYGADLKGGVRRATGRRGNSQGSAMARSAGLVCLRSLQN